MVLTFALLTTAIFSLWLDAGERVSATRRFAWCVPFLAAVATALAAGILQPIGVVWIAALAGLAALFSAGPRPRAQRIAIAAGILVLTAGLMTHQLPGFSNPRVIPALRFSADGLPYRLHLNFDKTSAGLILLAFCHGRIVRAADWRTMLGRVWPVSLGTMTVLMSLALAAGYVRFEPKFPAEAWTWVWANLCFTCMAEEALFRGFVQAQLQRAWKHQPRGEWWALGVAALLFGLAHAGGGPTYVVLSTVAGIGYGWAYLRTGRIEASILTHFALNAVHFFGFTYPALQRAG